VLRRKLKIEKGRMIATEKETLSNLRGAQGGRSGDSDRLERGKKRKACTVLGVQEKERGKVNMVGLGRTSRLVPGNGKEESMVAQGCQIG